MPRPRLSRTGLTAGLVLALLCGFLLLPIIAVGLRAMDQDQSSLIGPADWAALRFTLAQSATSALISVALAIPLARALARRRFPGRAALVALLGAPFILPVIVAVLGLLAVFGRAGLVNTALTALGLPPVSIYGFHGVVLAHVFFNMPLATRLILQAWLAIPAERFRLAASLRLGPRETRRLIEYPMLRSAIPGALTVIFLICLTSFAVALTLGGGPRATTLELAIYEAFRLEFDLARASLLALAQFVLGLGAALIALRLSLPDAMGTGLDRAVQRWDAPHPTARILDALTISLAAAFLLLPLAIVTARGVPELLTLPPSTFAAAGRSLVVALTTAVLTLTLAMPLAALVVRRDWPLVEGAGLLTLAISPLVLGTGMFLILFPLIDPGTVALPLTAAVNALMSLPFALRVLIPALRSVEQGYGRLADSLRLTGWARLHLLWWPRMRRALGFSAGLSAALAMGDLGIIAMFASPEHGTLPLELYRLMGAYRMGSAAGAALLLLSLAFGLFILFDRGGRLYADT
jgi:thiamine transport system permease protein